MPNPNENFFLAMRQARIAMHRGDFAGADGWTKMAERHLRIIERQQALLNQTPKANAKPKDPTKQLGYRNPWVWPPHWTPEQIAEARRKSAEEASQNG
jgi:hypothetical protein